MRNTIVKKIIPVILFALVLASCNGWIIQPLPYDPPTPFLQSTRTPAIYSPTPVIIGSSPTTTPTFLPTSTNIPSATPTGVPVETYTPTSLVNAPALYITILGCNTSIDITHGMGEVTNAYVTLKNVGNVELTNLVATLYALDEGRAHPDKTQEVQSLPVNYEITLKLTVDSTYKQESPVQVEVNSLQGLFPREGLASCRDLGLLAPKPDSLNTPVPGNP
jgi:hypothetical protein